MKSTSAGIIMYNLPSTQAARFSLSNSPHLLWLSGFLPNKAIFSEFQDPWWFIMIYWVWKITDDQIDCRRHGGGILCLVEVNCPLFASADHRKKRTVFDPPQKPTLVIRGCAQWFTFKQNQRKNRLERKRSLQQLVYLMFSGKKCHVESPPAKVQCLPAQTLWLDRTVICRIFGCVIVSHWTWFIRGEKTHYLRL